MEQYKKYPRSELIRNWDELIKLPREEVVKIHKQWKEIKEQNNNIHSRNIKEKQSKWEEAVIHMKSLGIDVFKYKNSGFLKKKNGYQAWFKKNVIDVIDKKYPYFNHSIPTAHMETKEVDGITLQNNQSPTNLVELYDKIVPQYRRKIKEVKKADKLLVKSIEYAVKHGIEIEDLNEKAIINLVDERAKDEYRENKIPDGTPIDLKHECYECNTYIVGERRCECGNRRISMVVEGDIIDGFYHYPEPF